MGQLTLLVSSCHQGVILGQHNFRFSSMFPFTGPWNEMPRPFMVITQKLHPFHISHLFLNLKWNLPHLNFVFQRFYPLKLATIVVKCEKEIGPARWCNYYLVPLHCMKIVIIALGLWPEGHGQDQKVGSAITQVLGVILTCCTCIVKSRKKGVFSLVTHWKVVGAKIGLRVRGNLNLLLWIKVFNQIC